MLKPTDFHGTVTAILVNGDRDESLQSQAVETVRVTYEGFEGEAHGGLTRPSCSRVLRQYPKRGTEIRNARQVTILAEDELQQIADALGIPKLPPEWIGANLVMNGIPQLTQLPPSSRLIFENGTSLVVDMENGPCKYPAEIIETRHPGKGLAFPKVARGLRGVTAWVEHVGEIAVGATARLHIPPQRIYSV